MSRRQWWAELFIQGLIFYSIATYFIEIELTGTEHSQGFWLWSERVVAGVFTLEYLIRWAASRSWLYPLRPMAIVDLLAILPFYVGFFVDLRSLRLIRTLRILRLFKLYRHSRALHNLTGAFERIRYEFAVIGLGVLVILWVSSVTIYEFEREAQPEVFGRLSDAGWYVLCTVTTVGYGDKVPVTPGGKVVAGLTMIAGLALFGTFMSLIGGAFLEEVRVARRAKHRSADLGPDAVLRAVREGTFAVASPEAQAEAVRLLTAACHALRDRGG
jgi:voltage-gated potassium channel